MIFITIGTQELFTQDIWEVDPFARWSDDPTGTWVDECNFRNSLILLDGYEVEHSVDGRSIAQFSVWDATSAIAFAEGQVVYIRDESYDIIFGGVIATIEEEKVYTGTVTAKIHKISCVDWTYLADKRLVFLAVENMLAGDIVRLIHSTILVDEGVTVGEIQDGALVQEFRAGYSSVSEALDALKEYGLGGSYIWFITEDKKLYFVSPSTYIAPWSLDGSQSFIAGQSRTIGNDKYVNRQYIIGGKARTSLLTEEKTGDGKTKTFVTARALAAEPIIKVNNVTKTVGIGEVDAEGSHDFYWNEGSNTITQDNTGTTLGESDVLHIEYYGLYDTINSAANYAEITARAALDGSSGIVEGVVTGTLLTTQAAVVAAAEAKLARYARSAEKIEFDTLESDLAVGQILPVTEFPTAEFLITSIRVTAPEGLNIYHVTACDGPADSAWESVFIDMNITARSGKIQIGALNESDLLIYHGFSTTWADSDYPNPFACGLVADDELSSDTLIPGFAIEDRWKYIVVYREGEEIFRKQVLSVEYLADRDIASVYIAASEAVGTISHIGIWGGEGCSATAGSGIELDKQAYVRNKTSLESLQIVFTEIKGWQA